MKKFLQTYSQLLISGLLILGATMLIVSLLPKRATFKYDFKLGRPWKHDNLLAPFDFAIKKSEETVKKEIAQIKADFAPYYVFQEQVLSQKLDHFKGELAVKLKIDEIQTNEQFNYFFNSGTRVLTQLYQQGIVDVFSEHESRADELLVKLIKGKAIDEKPLSAFLTLSKAAQKIPELLDGEGIDSSGIRMLNVLLERELSYNVFYDKERTEAQLASEIEQLSLTEGKVERDERVIFRGEIIDKEKYRKIASLKEVYDQNTGETGNYWIGLGQGIICLLCIIALLLFMSLFIENLFTNWSKLLFLLVWVVVAVVLTKMISQIEVFSIYLVPVCIIPIVIRAFYNFRVAMFMHFIVLVILGLMVAKPYEFICMHSIAAMAVLFRIGHINKRSQFFVSSAIVFLSYVLVYFAFLLIQQGGVSDFNPIDVAWLAGAALLTLFAQPFIFLVEKLFGFVSESTLSELADTNNSLLRNLAAKAPGTFQHTLQVANLAETCIQQIGGDSLLIRAGALYHDIGKLKQPKYFIENQHGGQNPHDKLSPEESARIIIDHVKDGIEMAKKSGLPELIIDFIRTHHGTTRTEYFYRNALANEENVDEANYRYPGPAPTSREMSVLMMCDAVEAASRSLKEYSVEHINKLVDGIIDHQMSLNQYHNADITLRDISVLKKVLKRKLLDIYHVRVEYPVEQKKTLG